MAMPTDFWRNEQSLNIFRTKPCQRLFRDGVCAWKSQCQFSHCLEWPRRQPRRHNYSPEICPHIRVTTGVNDGSAQIENLCTLGLRCPKAHSKEEVLFHPSIFKTTLCEEHSNSSGNQRNSRNAKRHKCHRYYCPFAHGVTELRTSDISQELRDQCLRSLDVFPSDVCCNACTRHWISQVPSQATQEEVKYQGAPGLDLPAPFPWPAKVPAQCQPCQALPHPVGPQGPLWPWLNAPPMTQQSPLTAEALTQCAPAVRERKSKEPPGLIKPTNHGLPPFKPFKDDGLDSLFALPFENDVQPPYKPASELQRTLHSFGEPRDPLDDLGAMPAFINIAEDGSTSVGGPLSMKTPVSPDAISQTKKARDLLGALFFEVL